MYLVDPNRPRETLVIEGFIGIISDFFGAQEKTRTSTTFQLLAPEASASTNSATWATDCYTRYKNIYGQHF